ncbi:hypothetical protein [Candidatus Phytoplasma ziziphi]|nr:hypothetical protein [Candidatus Phytoplasma ziziphi]
MSQLVFSVNLGVTGGIGGRSWENLKLDYYIKELFFMLCQKSQPLP